MRGVSSIRAVSSAALLLCLMAGCQQRTEKAELSEAGRDELVLEGIPGTVMDALKAKFPEAEIHKWTREEEDGIIVYDIEFEQAGRKFESDVKEDGTIHNWEESIDTRDLPEAVEASVEKKYPEAALREIMRISAVVDGKDTLEGYEIVLQTAEGEEVELTVAPEGKILEDSGQKKPEE